MLPLKELAQTFYEIDSPENKIFYSDLATIMRRTRLHLFAKTVVAVILASSSIYSLATQSAGLATNGNPADDNAKSGEASENISINPIVRGTITDTNGRPMKGVVVSDGFTCTVTNEKGLYIFARNANARFVWYSVPSDCKIPVHSSVDCTAMIYKPLSAKRHVYNFTLRRLPGGRERSFRLLVFGDPQITNAASTCFQEGDDNAIKKTDLQRFTTETMADVKQTISSWPSSTPVYAISMGDDVQYYGGYNPNLERNIRKALGSSRATVFSVIGNHDQDGRELYRRKWEQSFGPTDYSFNRGNIHFVCFNNVQFYRGQRYWQPGELTTAQMEWLKEDLRLADHKMKVVVCYHIPLTFGNNPKKGAQPLGLETEKGHYISSMLQQLLRQLKKFKGGYELFCGHTHFALNHEVNIKGQNIMERCHAAASGNIWQSNVNICGTPNGYYVYDIDGTGIKDSYYKGTFWPKEKQMTVFKSTTDFNGESYGRDWLMPKDKEVLIANVFNADSRWRVVAIEDGVEYEMKRINQQGQDAFAAGYHHQYGKRSKIDFVSKKNGYLIMNHLYYYEPRSPKAQVIIKATDPYGNTYTASADEVVSSPFYNFAHYYSMNK